MNPACIQTLAFISYCSSIQGRVAGASASIYKFDSVIRGKSAWTLRTDKLVHKCILREDKERDKYAVTYRLYQHPKGGCTHQERYQE